MKVPNHEPIHNTNRAIYNISKVLTQSAYCTNDSAEEYLSIMKKGSFEGFPVELYILCNVKLEKFITSLRYLTVQFLDDASSDTSYILPGRQNCNTCSVAFVNGPLTMLSHVIAIVATKVLRFGNMDDPSFVLTCCQLKAVLIFQLTSSFSLPQRSI